MMNLRAYPNLRQLSQLRRLDPASYRSARVALRGGLPKMANELARRAMHAAFDRLLITRQVKLGASVNKPRCDAYLPGPNATLKRCRCIARYRLVLQSGGEPYLVRRCRECRDEAQAKAAAGATFEILSEETIGGNSA